MMPNKPDAGDSVQPRLIRFVRTQFVFSFCQVLAAYGGCDLTAARSGALPT